MNIETITASPGGTDFNRVNSPLRIAVSAMEAGKCLEVRFSEEELAGASRKSRQSAANVLCHKLKKKLGWSFAIRTQPNGFNIYRIA